MIKNREQLKRVTALVEQIERCETFLKHREKDHSLFVGGCVHDFSNNYRQPPVFYEDMGMRLLSVLREYRQTGIYIPAPVLVPVIERYIVSLKQELADMGFEYDEKGLTE